jgi:antiviral helicase SKI2
LPKVDVDGVVDRHLISRMKDGIAELRLLLDEWLLSGFIPEVDWERIRDLEFQEMLRSRDVMIDQLSTRGCKLCPEFFDHARVSLLILQRVLRTFNSSPSSMGKKFYVPISRT